jgi:hypothetical protein
MHFLVPKQTRAMKNVNVCIHNNYVGRRRKKTGAQNETQCDWVVTIKYYVYMREYNGDRVRMETFTSIYVDKCLFLYFRSPC